ncbi:SET domain-containing protein [Massarina eburnea CBS 473.64]|uniref:SET domain-containing protein n=1 Tax=Massarina eburnea CBS 473.64 TaxID=1395130 RepID=A0A6A6S2B9_9PLEO|nr:SET domain-containing protein [Massarina eburnea CBS 473.64]
MSDHPYTHLLIPPSSPLTLQPSAGQGWGIFATNPIPKNSPILTETPLFHIPKPHPQITEHDLYTAFSNLSLPNKAQFSRLRDNASTLFTSLTNAFAENSFATVTPPGHGLYLLHSRFNHSCIPNAKIPSLDGTSITSFACRDIARGEEVTVCYNTDFECRIRSDRHKCLRFTCVCEACRRGTAFQVRSDMRRTLIRGLQYLTLGTDIDTLGIQNRKSGSHIISDPKLRRAAETMNIPLPSRLLYNLLIMVLLEHEGLLDDLMVQRMEPGIVTIAHFMQTKENADVARQAMAQETWLGKLCTAFVLWGREDLADGELAVQLRQLRQLRLQPGLS